MACNVPTCDRSADAPLGMCWAHYKRNLRYGSPTAGRPTYDGDGLMWLLAALSADTDDCQPFPLGGGIYGKVQIEGRTIRAPQLACAMAHGPANGRLTRHMCKTKRCCNKRHVVWGTQLENMQDRRRDGTHAPGETNPNSKLSCDDVATIRALRGKLPQTEIADMFNIAQSTVSSVQLEKTWRDLNA